jgi:hypothetical protein
MAEPEENLESRLPSQASDIGDILAIGRDSREALIRQNDLVIGVNEKGDPLARQVRNVRDVSTVEKGLLVDFELASSPSESFDFKYSKNNLETWSESIGDEHLLMQKVRISIEGVDHEGTYKIKQSDKDRKLVLSLVRVIDGKADMNATFTYLTFNEGTQYFEEDGSFATFIFDVEKPQLITTKIKVKDEIPLERKIEPLPINSVADTVELLKKDFPWMTV